MLRYTRRFCSDAVTVLAALLQAEFDTYIWRPSHHFPLLALRAHLESIVLTSHPPWKTPRVQDRSRHAWLR